MGRLRVREGWCARRVVSLWCRARRRAVRVVRLERVGVFIFGFCGGVVWCVVGGLSGLFLSFCIVISQEGDMIVEMRWCD